MGTIYARNGMLEIFLDIFYYQRILRCSTCNYIRRGSYFIYIFDLFEFPRRFVGGISPNTCPVVNLFWFGF